MNKIFLITSGDPAGIGPEIILKLALSGDFCKRTSVVIGRKSIYEELIKKTKALIKINTVKNISEAKAGALNLMEPGKKTSYVAGDGPGAASAEEAISYVDLALDVAAKEKIAALITAPLSKKSVSLVRKNFSGHTFYLADKTGVKREDVVMLFVSNSLKAALVTQHLPLSQVSSAIREASIIKITSNACEAMKKTLGVKNPKIAVCSLNPHAGEGGILGREELDEIIPAIKKLKDIGIDAYGPVSSDAAARDCLMNKAHLLVAMYHEQGIVPVKLFSHGRAVNMTWGLPFLRFSPLHGTAFDIAGKGAAKADSMIETFNLASKITDNLPR